MRAPNTTDPWNRHKDEIDPWDSPWRKKHEKALITGLEEDCAFGVKRHHAQDADCAFGSSTHHAPQRTATWRARIEQMGRTATNKPPAAVIASVIVICVLLAIFIGGAVMMYSAPYYLYSVFFSLMEFLPVLIFLAVFIPLIKNKHKK